MVSSMKREVQTLAISLLVAVISLTSTALAAPPVVKFEKRITPSPAFAGSPGKSVQDASGNKYVTDYWATGIVKLDRAGNRIGFVATKGRPVGVALLSTGDLVVSMLTPKPYVAVYSQAGAETAVMGTGFGQFYKPLAVTVDSQDTVYVVDSGDFGSNLPCVQVFSKTGAPIATGVAVAGYPTNSFGSMAPLSGVKPNGQFLEPAGIDYEPANNQIVVVDTFNGRIQFFQARNGASPYAWVKTIGKLGTAPVQFSSPQGVAFEYARDASGQTVTPLTVSRMYVLEKSKHKVVVIDPAANGGAGAELFTINGSTVTGGELRYPNDLIYDQPTNTLFVASAATATPANLATFC
ncbi:MAG TPA: NHL repeat-containing protein, partial [Geobacteraceae bacterium]